MRNVSDKSCRENENTHLVLNSFLFFANLSYCEVMWKNTVEPGRPQMAIWRMRIACWVTKATDTHPEYVIVIAFPLQQQLHERAPMLRHTHLACPVFICY
jgi:hypothetical protein